MTHLNLVIVFVIHLLVIAGGTEMQDDNLPKTPDFEMNTSENVTKGTAVKKSVTELRGIKWSTGGFQSHWTPILNPKHTVILQTQSDPMKTDIAKMSSEATHINMLSSKLPTGYTMSSGYAMSSGGGMNFQSGGYHQTGLPSNHNNFVGGFRHGGSSGNIGGNTDSMRCGTTCGSSTNYMRQFSTDVSNAFGRLLGVRQPEGGGHPENLGGNTHAGSDGYKTTGDAAFVGSGGTPRGVSSFSMQPVEGRNEENRGHNSGDTRGDIRGNEYGSQNLESHSVGDNLSGSGVAGGENYAKQTGVFSVGYEGGSEGDNSVEQTPGSVGGDGYGGRDINEPSGFRDGYRDDQKNKHHDRDTVTAFISKSTGQDVFDSGTSEIPAGDTYETSTQVVQGRKSEGNEEYGGNTQRGQGGNFGQESYKENSAGEGLYVINPRGVGNENHRESFGVGGGDAGFTSGGSIGYQSVGNHGQMGDKGTSIDPNRGVDYGSGYIISIKSTVTDNGHGGGPILPATSGNYGSVATTAYNGGSIAMQNQNSNGESGYGSAPGGVSNGGSNGYERSVTNNNGYMGSSNEGKQYESGADQAGVMGMFINGGHYGDLSGGLGSKPSDGDGYRSSGVDTGYRVSNGNSQYESTGGGGNYGVHFSGSVGYGSFGGGYGGSTTGGDGNVGGNIGGNQYEGGGYGGSSSGGGYGEISTGGGGNMGGDTRGNQYESSSIAGGEYGGSSSDGGYVRSSTGGGYGGSSTGGVGNVEGKTGSNQYDSSSVQGGSSSGGYGYEENFHGGVEQNKNPYGSGQQDGQNNQASGSTTYVNPSESGRYVSAGQTEYGSIAGGAYQTSGVSGYENIPTGSGIEQGGYGNAGLDNVRNANEGSSGYGSSSVHESSSAGLVGTGYDAGTSVSMSNSMISNSNGQMAIHKAPCNKEGGNYAIRMGSNTGGGYSNGAMQRMYSSQFESSPPIYRANVETYLTPRSGAIMRTSQSKRISYNSVPPLNFLPSMLGLFKPGTIYARTFAKKDN